MVARSVRIRSALQDIGPHAAYDNKRVGVRRSSDRMLRYVVAAMVVGIILLVVECVDLYLVLKLV